MPFEWHGHHRLAGFQNRRVWSFVKARLRVLQMGCRAERDVGCGALFQRFLPVADTKGDCWIKQLSALHFFPFARATQESR